MPPSTRRGHRDVGGGSRRALGRLRRGQRLGRRLEQRRDLRRDGSSASTRQTHDVQADIPVEVIPTWVVGGGAMVVADGDLWVDRRAGQARRPRHPAEERTRPSFGSTRRRTRSCRTFRSTGGVGAADLTFLDGDLWVLVFGDETVEHRMEVVRGRPFHRRRADEGSHSQRPGQDSLVAADGRLVTAVGGDGAVNVDGRVIQIDPATGEVAPVEIPSRFFTPMPVLWRGRSRISAQSGVHPVRSARRGLPGAASGARSEVRRLLRVHRRRRSRDLVPESRVERNRPTSSICSTRPPARRPSSSRSPKAAQSR